MGIDPVSLAITVALNAAAMAITASQTIEGPRLTDLSVTVADYGTPMNYFLGQRRFEVPCFYAEPIKERKKRRKTKGGKYNEYTYYGTWATIVADQEIAQVDQIFFDRHKVYDMGTGENIFSLGDGYELQNFVRIYLGTEDQEPDERMVATVEAVDGVGTCPAYLGISYIFFEDVPLEKVGNRLPQVSVVASTSGEPSYPYTLLADAWLNRRNILFSPDRRLVWIGSNLSGDSPYTVVNVQPVSTFTTGTQTAEVRAIDPFGILWAITAADDTIVGTFADGTSAYTSGVVKRPDTVSDAWIVDLFAFDFLGTPWVGMVPAVGRYELMYYEPGGWTSKYTIDLTGYEWHPSFFCQDSDGHIWAVGAAVGITDTLYLYNVTGSGAHRITGLSQLGGGAHDLSFRHYADSTHDHFLVEWDGDMLIIDRQTGNLLDTVSGLDGSYTAFKNNRGEAPWYQFDSTTQFVQRDPRDGSVIRVLQTGDWLPGASHVDGVYDSINHAWIGLQGDGDMIWYYLDRVVSNGVTLEAICTKVALQTGMLAEDFDFSDLDQVIQGHSWTQGAGREAVGPLIELHDSDIRPHGFQLEGLKRGGDVSGPTIETEWMVRSGEEKLYSIRVIGDSDLPRRIFLSFADKNADQQANTALFSRNASAVDTLRELSIDMTTTAMFPSEAQPLVERMMRRHWTGSVRPQNKLTPRELALEPGDNRVLGFDGEYLRCRLIRLTIAANRVLGCVWERDFGEVAVLIEAEGAEQEGRPASTVYTPGFAVGWVLDIPLIADVHDQTTPFLYIAGTRDGDDGWSGADFWHSDSGTSGSFTSSWDGLGASEEGTGGTVEGVLPAALTTVMDEASELVVSIGDEAELDSITQEQLENDATLNIALVGDEIIQFRDAEQLEDGTWQLTGLLRGARGTEQHVGTHEDGERFVLLSDFVKRHDIGASEIGDTDYYKVGSPGKNVEAVPPIIIPFSAAAQRPYSVWDIQLVRDDVTGDWDIGWTRRSRIGGAALNGQDVPLGETSESYKVRILNDYGETVRTITTTTAETTYTNAMQTADFGAPILDIEVEIVQMSPALSIEGFPAQASA